MRYNMYVYIFTIALTIYLIRVLPLTLIRKPIHSRFLKSFLYYVPYVTLAVMTFPAIVQETESTLIGSAALVLGIVLAWFGAGLLPVAVSCCAVVFLMDLFL